MGRRSDHTRDELEALILAAGQALMEEGGLARFSAREVAKRIGYSVGTVMHLFGGIDGLVLAINTETLALWTAALEARLAADGAPGERIRTLVAGYFSFAAEHPNLWSAIYEHRVTAIPAALEARRAGLMDLVTREVAAVLPGPRQDEAGQLARSLVACVHGHCAFAIAGTFALLGEEDPLDLAIRRVDEILRANGARPGL